MYIFSSKNKDTLTSYFPNCINLISFSCFITVTINSSTIFNIYIENGQLFLVPNSNGFALISSPFKLILAICLIAPRLLT